MLQEAVLSDVCVEVWEDPNTGAAIGMSITIPGEDSGLRNYNIKEMAVRNAFVVAYNISNNTIGVITEKDFIMTMHIKHAIDETYETVKAIYEAMSFKVTNDDEEGYIYPMLKEIIDVDTRKIYKVSSNRKEWLIEDTE